MGLYSPVRNCSYTTQVPLMRTQSQQMILNGSMAITSPGTNSLELIVYLLPKRMTVTSCSNLELSRISR